jgi:ferredoxin
MIVFAFFLQEPLQLNLTGCMDCKKGHIRDVLEQRLGAVGERFSPDISERIIMVTDKSELRFSPSQLDRRSFFQLLRKGAMQEMAKFIIDKEEKRPVYATVKRLPLKRELLNMVCRNHNAIERKRLINNYYYSVSIKGECDLCGACGGVCPTGALKVQWDDPIGLYFSSYLCIGCGLCVDICEDKKIQLTPQVSDDIFQTIKIGS